MAAETPTEMPTGRPAGNPLVTFVFLLGLLAALCGLAEGVARWKWTEDQLVMVRNMPFLEDDPVLLWRLRPNLNTTVEGKRMQTNALGMRDDPVAPKSADRIRILSLGESTTWGFGVEAAETYTEQLVHILETRDQKAEALNAGVPAWSIYQSYLYLEREGLALQPDVVMVYHLQNDLLPRGNNPRDPFDVRMTDRQLSESRRSLATVMQVVGKSRLRQALWRYYLAPALAGPVAPRGTPDVTRVPDADRTAALEGIFQLCERQQIKLVLVKPVYGRGNHAEDTMLNRFATTHPSVQFVDLPAIKQRNGQADFFQVDDAHPTVAGHTWIAFQIAGGTSL